MAATALSFLITAVDQASSVFNGVSTTVQGTGQAAEKMSGMTKLALAATGAAAVKFGGDSIAAYTDAEQSAARLQDALDRFPATADTSVEALSRLNGELVKKTRFDDDAYASGQAILAQFGLTGKQIEELTPLLGDYAAKTGTDIETAAEAFGKATMGQGKALKAIGIDFADAGDPVANLQQLMDGLNKQVKGFAEKDGKTAAGQAEILGNQYGNLQETVGSKLLPVMLQFTTILLGLIDFVSRNSEVIIPLVAALGGLAAVVYTIITVTKVWTAVQAAFNAVMALNPVVLITLAIVALVAAVVIAYRESETFRDIVNGAFSAVLAVIQGVWGWVSNNWPLLLAILTGPIGLAVGLIIQNWETIKSGATTAFQWVGDKWQNWVVNPILSVKNAFGGLFDGIKDAFVKPINWIIDRWNNLGFTLGPIRIPHFPDIPSITIDTPNISRISLARGGLAIGPADVTVGDNPSRRELVLPEEKWAAYGITKAGRGGGGGTTIYELNFHGPVYADDKVRFGVMVRDALAEAVRAGQMQRGELAGLT